MDSLTKEQLEFVEEVEPQLGIEPGFLRRLLKDDDWSFVIKTHAFVESCISREISAYVQPAQLQAFLAKLDLAGGRHSKLELLKALGCIDADEIKAVKGLGKIRNQLVHNVRHVGFSLAKHVAELTANERDQFVTVACAIFYDSSATPAARETNRAKILSMPKAYLWLSALHVAAMSLMRCDTATSRAEIDTRERELLEMKAKHLQHLLSASEGRAAPAERFPAGIWGGALFRSALEKHEGEDDQRTEPTETS